MTIDDIRNVLRSPISGLKALVGATKDARTIAAEAEADLAALNARRPDVLLNGSDKDLAKLDDSIAAASRTAERAKALADALDVKAAEVAADQAEQGRRDRYEAARIAVTDIAVTFPERYRRLVELGREMMADLGEARRLRAAANRDLPEGAAELPDPEAFRWKPSRATIVSKEPMTLWCREDGTPLPLEWQGRVHPLGDGVGKIPTDSYSSTDETRFVRAACWRVTVQPATSLAILKSFDVGLEIPPLFQGEAYGWRQDERYSEEIGHKLATLRDHEPPRAPATVEEVIAADKLDDLKSRHRIA